MQLCLGRLIICCTNFHFTQGGRSIGRGDSQQASTSESNSYNWRSEEVDLVSAILGAAEHHGVEGERLPDREELPRRDTRKQAPPSRPRKRATQPDIYHLDKVMVQLRQELNLYRSEIKELKSIIKETRTSSRLPSPRHRRRLRWRKWLNVKR